MAKAKTIEIGRALSRGAQKFEPRARCFTGWILAFVFALLPQPSFGQVEQDDELDLMPFNLPIFTLGGKQLWTDCVHFQGWRIQQNAYTKHFRLVDPRNVRQAWGSLEQCEERLDKIRNERGLAPVTGKVLILLHGLGRSRSSMNGLAEYLQKQLGYEIVNVSYASTRASLDEHARALASVIDHLPKDSEIDVVAHSLGNLVLRRYLFNVASTDGEQPSSARIRRIVMLGPPNNGAELAKQLKRTGILGVVMGASAKQLAEMKGTDFQLELATPQAEFGIVAGNGSIGPLTNPLLTGENDFFVQVEETRLPGASDFVVLNVAHGFMLNDAAVHGAVANFLKHGYFVSAENRQPISTASPDSWQSSPALPTK